MPDTPKSPKDLDKMRAALDKLVLAVETDYKDLAEKAQNLANIAEKLDGTLLEENNKIAKDAKKSLLISALDELFMTSSGAQLRNGQAQALMSFLEPALGYIEAKIKLYNIQNNDLKKKLQAGIGLDKTQNDSQRKLK